MNSHALAVMTASETNEWYTPIDLFTKLNAEFNFTTDPCAEPTNRLGLPVFFTKEQDGLSQEWKGNVFINPPYDQVEAKWLKKASEYRGGVVAFLL